MRINTYAEQIHRILKIYCCQASTSMCTLKSLGSQTPTQIFFSVNGKHFVRTLGHTKVKNLNVARNLLLFPENKKMFTSRRKRIPSCFFDDGWEA